MNVLIDIPYRVILVPKGQTEMVQFDCAARCDSDAESMAQEAYPHATIETCLAFAHLLDLGLEAP